MLIIGSGSAHNGASMVYQWLIDALFLQNYLAYKQEILIIYTGQFMVTDAE